MPRFRLLAAAVLLLLAGAFLLFRNQPAQTVPKAVITDATPAPAPAASVPEQSASAALPAAADHSLTPDFLERTLDDLSQVARFSLPDGRAAVGSAELVRRDAQGVLSVQGRLTQPAPGFFFFQRQTAPGRAGAFFGHVRFDRSKVAFRIDPAGPGGASMLVAHPLDEVICANFAVPREDAVGEPQNAPPAHPIDIPIPAYQNGVVPLQSLPGATGVIYLDFDGELGPFTGWGSYDAAPSGASNAQIKEVWQRVSEDFQALSLNVTTDRKVFDNAPPGRRQHVMMTPTNTASPGNGGVAMVGSFNSTGDTVCWVFFPVGKAGGELASHEVGHTLGLSHDGRTSPAETYYGGAGAGDVGWAPIMGVGFYKNLTQWSKGEYPSANNTQDDLAILSTNNNAVAYRTDDYGATLSSAGYLEILPDDSVSNEGIIETRTDVDAFRFTTAGGAATLNVSGVEPGPNLDVLAEIYDAANTLIATENPDALLDASVSATLPAGEYTLRVSGVGRGSPSVDGYTDYSSTGAYLITGSVAGAVKADRFTIAENSANGSAIGTVLTRLDHAGAPLTFAITSGNTGGALSIDPATGALSVANSAPLNFEALSLRWDDPATLAIFVSITDSANAALNENIRVVITVTDVNEAPVLSVGALLTVLEHTRLGTPVRIITASDPDRFDLALFSIVGGNVGGAFAIDANTGQLSIAADLNATTQPVYNLTVRATDQGTPARTTDATLIVNVLDLPDGVAPGSVVRAYFENITGSAVANLTADADFPSNPNSLETLTSFDAGTHGDNFGSTVTGYVIPPTTGDYTFWIASDGASELRLSTSAFPSSAALIASVTTSTGVRVWTAGAQSSAIALNAGQLYFLEARHKESTGADHVSVAWQGPGIAQQIIPGARLAPFPANYAPKIVTGIFSVRENALNGAPVGTVAVSDVNAADTPSGFAIVGDTGANVFGIEAVSGRIFVVNSAALNAATTPAYTLTIQVTDSGAPALTGSGNVTVNVLAAAAVPIFTQEIWDNIAGGNVAALTSDPRYPNAPSRTRGLTTFDTGADFADAYGSRIRGYVTAPATGNFTFYVAGDDEMQLFLSTNLAPANATQIASVATATARNTWTTFPSQTSAPVSLTAGQKYFIEVRHKEASATDFAQVAWTGPGIASVTIIPASALQGFDANLAPAWLAEPYVFTVAEGTANGAVVGTVAASDPNNDALTYAIIGGNVGGAFAINAQTGVVTVANRAALPVGQTASLQIRAQDNGGGVYPLQSITATANITVTSALTLTNPGSSSVDIPSGVGLVLTATNAGWPDASLVWAKINGPGAVAFDNANALVTGATFSASGTYLLRLTEMRGGFTTSFDLTVRVGLTPAGNFGPSVNAGADALLALPGTITLAGAASDDGGPAVLTTTWSKMGGPGAVTFGDASALTSTASFAPAGNYTLRLIANDGAVQTFDDVLVMTNGSSVTLIASDANAGESGGDGGAFTITRTAPTDAELTVSFSISGSATMGADYASFGTSATMLAGAASAIVNIAPLNDSAAEGNETVTLTLAAGGYAIGSAASATVVLVDDEPFVAINAPVSGVLNVPANVGVVLSATASDNGSPILAWSKVSGPGIVTFGNAANVETTALFSAPGAYVLRLTASDGQASSSDEVTVNFAAAPYAWTSQAVGTVNPAPTFSIVNGLHTLTSAGDGIPSAGTPDHFHFLHQPASGNVQIVARILNVPNVDGTNSRAGVMIRESAAADAREVFVGLTSAGGSRFVQRSAAGAASTGASGTATLPAWVRLMRSGNVFTAQVAPDSAGNPGAWTTLGTTTIAMNGTAFAGLAATSGNDGTSANFTFDRVTVSPGNVNVGPSISAGPDLAATVVGNSFDGTFSDDGLPNPPAAVTTLWSVASGPGSVNFADTTAVDTSASYFAGGNYVLRIVADDGEVRTFDDAAVAVVENVFSVTATDPNAAETSGDAGQFTITRTGPTTAQRTVNFTISGSATAGSDHAAMGSNVFVPSGASSVVVNVAPVDDSVIDPAETVTLTIATGSGYGVGTPASATVTIADNDFAPIATITSPTMAEINVPAGVGVLLEGGASDDGQPGPLAFAWSKISGPGTVFFGTPNAANTTATFSANGSYALRLSASDGLFSGADEITIHFGVVGYNWTVSGLGTVMPAPAFTFTNGLYTLAAGGNGITSSGSTPDNCEFIYQPVSGNVQLTARVLSVPNVDGTNSRGGVMIRESLDPDARMATVGITSLNSARFTYRTISGGSVISATSNVTPPYWVRLTRAGNVFTTQIAPDVSGSPGTFTALGATPTIGMSANAFIGLAASSGNNGTSANYTFDKVTLTPSPVNVAPFVNAGADATVTLPANANLDGTASDDALPIPPANVTTTWSASSGPGAVSFGNAALVDTTASFANTGSYVLRLTASDGAVKTFDDIALTVQLAPIEQWRLQHFGADVGNAAIAGNSANPDSDERNNLLEYFLASDPLAPGGAGLVTDLETIGAERYLRLTIARNPAATDVSFAVKTSGDLGSWSSSGTTIETNTSTTLRVRDNTPVSSGGPRYLRLEVTHP